MMGKSHISMGVATMVLATDTYFLLQQDFMPQFCHTAAAAVCDFLFASGSMPLWAFLPCGVVLFLLGNLVPDMDAPNSLLGRYIYVPVKHRTWMHAIYLSCVFLVLGIFTRLLFWLGAGVYFHLLWDSPSKWGIDWFYPKHNKHHLVLYDTNEPSERVFCTVVWVITVLLSVLTLYLQFRPWFDSLHPGL